MDLDLTQDATAGTRSSRAKDLAQYLSNVLALSLSYASKDDRESVAWAVAGELASGRHDGGYLLATLYARHLAMRQPLDAATAVAQIPQGLPAMLNLQLETLGARQPWLRLIMTAVASGFGRGMPLDLVHVATQAFVPEDSADGPTLDDVRGALESAAFYLRTNVDRDGRRLYHFFHQSLTDHFHDDSSSSRLFAQLMSTVPKEKGPNGFTYRRDGAPPYLQAHALDHAAATGNPAAIDRLLLDPQFLLVARGTLDRLPKPTSRSARRVARVLGRRPFAWDPAFDVGAQRLQLALARCGGATLARRLDAALGSEAPPLYLRWATDDDPAGLTGCLDKPCPQPSAVAIAADDDVVLALIGGVDGSVQAWDNGRRFLLPNVHEGGVEHLIVVEAEGGAQKAISYGTDRQFVVIDASTGKLEARATIPGADVSALAPTCEMYPSVFLAGYVDGTIGVIGLTPDGFDLLDVQETGVMAPITSLACLAASDQDDSIQLRCMFGSAKDTDDEEERWPVLGTLDGRPVTVKAGWNGAVRIRDNDELLYQLESYDRNMKMMPTESGDIVRVLTELGPAVRKVMASLNNRTDKTATSADIPVPKRDLVAADIGRVGELRIALTAHEDGCVRVWDLDLTPRPGLLGRAVALFVTRVSEREVAVAVSTHPSTIKVWDLETGAEKAELLGLGQVTHASVAAVGGKLLALTATAEKGLDLYDVIGDYHLSSMNLRLSITALGLAAYGSEVLAVAGGADGDINLWRIADGDWRHLGSLEGHGQEITGVRFTSGNSPHMLLATFADSAVRVWSLDDLTAPPWALSADPDRRVVACSDGVPALHVVIQDKAGRIEIWDAVKGILVGHVDRAPQATTAAISVVEGELRLVTGAPSDTMQVWDARAGEEIGPPVSLPSEPSRILTHDTGVIVTFWRDAAVFNWSNRETPSERTAAVRLTHVHSWFPGEILASDPDADSWDLQTWESWTEGKPASWGMCIPSAKIDESPRALRRLVAQRLEPEGLDVIELEPGEFEISVPGVEGGRWLKFPLYYIFTHQERPETERQG